MVCRWLRHIKTIALVSGMFPIVSAWAQAENTASNSTPPPAETSDEAKPTETAKPSGKPPAPKAAEQSDGVSVESKVKEKVTRRTKTTRATEKISGTGLSFFGSADFAFLYTTPSTDIMKKIESTQLGLGPTFKMDGSVFTRRIALDVGVGLQYARYNGTILALPVVDDFGDIGLDPVNRPYSLGQATLFVETAGRLRFKKMQAGIQMNLLYALGSAGFSPLPTVDADENYLALVGPQLVYETNLKNNILRIGGGVTASVSGTKRNSYLASLGVGIGTYIINPVATIKTQSEKKFRTRVTREVIQIRAQTAEITDNVSFIFDSQMVNFKTNSSELNTKSAGFLTALGEIFFRERDLWGKLLIEGHTDSRGSQELNLKLSLSRAKSVLEQLANAGVARESMEAAGLGSTKLLVNPEVNEVDYARNRRVEIRILGLKDARALQKYVDEVQSKFFGKPAQVRTVPVPEKITPDVSPEPETPDPGLLEIQEP